MTDSLSDDRRFRLLNVIDNNKSEILEIKADTYLPALWAMRVLKKLEMYNGL